jgi:hypothetical protein
LAFHAGTPKNNLRVREFRLPAIPAGGTIDVKLVAQGTCRPDQANRQIGLSVSQLTEGIRWRAKGAERTGRGTTTLNMRCIVTAQNPVGQIRLDADSAIEFLQ